MRLEPVDLNHEVEQVLPLLERTIPKMIEIEPVLTENIKIVEADSAQIRQLLVNLALNAIDAMLEGGKLTIETRNLTITTDKTASMKPGEFVELIVSDTGKGMDQETIDHIFEPFYTVKGLAYSSGLGLAVVHGIVQSHGGYIICDSSINKGTTFRIFLPALSSETKYQVSSEEQTLPGGKEIILLVDDEEPIRELANRFLSRIGYQIISVVDGIEAINIYEKEWRNISLIILDLILPKLSGLKCLEKILEINPDAKIIIASGFSDAEKGEELIKTGVKAFVKKPLDFTRLQKLIREILDAK